MAKTWVKLNRDYPLEIGGKVHKVVEEGTVGFILPKTAEEWQDAKEGFAPVKFPQTHGFQFPLNALDELKPLPVEESIEIIREFEGHHTNKRGEFQFNIKFYGCPKLPDAVEHGMTLEQKNRAWDEIMYNELHNLVDKNYCDGVLSDDFDWVLPQWHTAGRSGGWLVLRHYRDMCADGVVEDYEQNREYLVNDIEDLREYIEGLGTESVIQKEYEDLHSHIEISLKDMRIVEAEASDLARDLTMIQDMIDRQKAELPKYMSTMECWEHYMPTFDCIICEREFPGNGTVCEECEEWIQERRSQIKSKEEVAQ